MDEFTERLAEAVETARNNKMLELEYMSFYAKQKDAYNEGKEDGIEEGLKSGLKSGLFAMVKALKPVLKDFDMVYNVVIGTEEYANVTREEVMEFYQMCP